MSATYTPGYIPDDPSGLVAAVRREFASIKRALEDAQPSMRLVTLHKAPDRVFGGMIVRADGVDWQPDGVNGAGVYLRNEANTDWDFIVTV